MSAEYQSPDREVDRVILGFVADYVIPRLPGKRVLELGLGDGVWTPKLAAAFPELVSVDGSWELVNRAVEGGFYAVHSLFEDYTPALRFDTVIASYVLEHVDDPKVIVERARDVWLKPGGHLAVVVPHALSLHRRLAVRMGLSSHPGQLGPSDERMGHQRCFDCFEMERLLIDCGFSVRDRRGMFCKVLPNSMLAGCSGAQLRGMFELGLDLPIEYAASAYFLAQKG